MEEGPEPHEWVERGVEHHHHEHEHGDTSEEARRWTIVSAITAAVLAVFAALGSLLSGHEANQAILHQNQATDQWSYYQAKSTKGHIYEMGKELLKALSEAQGTADKMGQALALFEKKLQKYEEEKEEPKHTATHLENESTIEFEKHHYFAQGVAAFQVGIVLASISIMVRYRAIWGLSLVGGAAGIMLLLIGLLH